MPTYAFRCTCGNITEVVLPMRVYIEHPPAFICCNEPMQRYFEAPPQLAIHTRTSDAIYDGMRAQDGADISTRSKHRAYMKARNLTTIDDFKDTWAKEAKERDARLAGEDASRKRDVAQAIEQLGG